jgi:hypothetical protein
MKERVRIDLVLKREMPPPPEMLLDSGWGRGQSLKASRCESEGERESLCILVVGLVPLKVGKEWLKT